MNKSVIDRGPRLVESIDERRIRLIRLILASSALVAIFIDPAAPDRFVPTTYALLIVYVAYSLTLFLASRWLGRRTKGLLPWATWVDVLFFTVFIGLTSGTNSIFFFFYYFTIIIASFCQGFAAGLRITLASALLFTVVGYVTTTGEVELNRLLLRPVSMVLLGYMIAYWGGFELELKRRLKFLKDITRLSNPRFGIDHTINWAMEQFCKYYEADDCLLVVERSSEDYQLRRIARQPASRPPIQQTLAREMAAVLLLPSPNEAVVYRKKPPGVLLYNINTNQSYKAKGLSSALLNTLDSERFMSVPVNYRGRSVGRFYVLGGRQNFKLTDVDFILQAIEQVTPQLDNIRLVDHLASDAAEREREKIARDIHDSVVQPYIGLQMGLAALQQKVERGDGDVLQHVTALSDLTVKGIADLRHYAGGIKTGEGDNNTLLLGALRRFASRFAEATGIDVKIDAPEDIGINDRLAAELFQMITEALSNVRRHTEARVAWASLTQESGNVTLRIENEDLSSEHWEPFSPRSLTERAASLGGQLRVYRNGNDRTVVQIQIPL